MADIKKVVEELKNFSENAKKNQESIEGFFIGQEAAEKRSEARMNRVAKEEAERFKFFKAVDEQAVKAFSNLESFAKKQYDATLGQVKLIEQQRADAKAEKLKNLEALREAKIGDKADAAKKVVGDDIKEPTFLNKIFKLALGIFGAAVFIKLIQNLDKVKAFANDKLVPALISTFNFLKDILTPLFEFISDNFSGVVTGVVVAAGAVIGAKIFIKLANLFKKIRFALLLVQSGVISLVANLIATGKALGGGLLKVMKLVVSAANGLRIFMFTSFLPAIGGFISGLLASFGAVIIPLLPLVLVAAGIAAVVAGIGFALTKLRDALGFESVFDTVMFGVLKLKDAFFTIANFYITIYNAILGFIKGVVGSLPDLLLNQFPKLKQFAENEETGKVEKLATDSAERFRAEKTGQPMEGEGLRKAPEGLSVRAQMAEERKADLRARAAAGDPNVVVTTSRGGMLDDAQADALKSGKMTMGEVLAMQQKQQQDLAPPQPAGEASVANAVVNAPVSTTNVNNATTVMDAEPAIDGLDRFAMGSAF